jgi:hypothetical protein
MPGGHFFTYRRGQDRLTGPGRTLDHKRWGRGGLEARVVGYNSEHQASKARRSAKQPPPLRTNHRLRWPFRPWSRSHHRAHGGYRCHEECAPLQHPRTRGSCSWPPLGASWPPRCRPRGKWSQPCHPLGACGPSPIPHRPQKLLSEPPQGSATTTGGAERTGTITRDLVRVAKRSADEGGTSRSLCRASFL